jgi:hypothetical protein
LESAVSQKVIGLIGGEPRPPHQIAFREVADEADILDDGTPLMRWSSIALSLHTLI